MPRQKGKRQTAMSNQTAKGKRQDDPLMAQRSFRGLLFAVSLNLAVWCLPFKE
jgi:hypothetical protein